MNTARNRFAVFAVIAMGVLLWSVAAAAFAQRPALTERGYEEMRRLAQRLDSTAQHAADQARHQDSWVYRHDSRFVRAVSDFARRANRLDERMANYRAAPWRVDDELRGLLRNAQDVQSLARRSREADEHTVADWNEAVAVLNRMIRLYDADVRGTGRYDWNQPAVEYRGESQAGDYGNYGHRSDRLARLARELDDHATRAHELAEAAVGSPRGRIHRDYFDTIHHFNDQARDFDQRLASGQADYRELRDEARHLLDDARRADADMRQNNVFPEVWDEWQAAMRTLDRILGLLGT